MVIVVSDRYVQIRHCATFQTLGGRPWPRSVLDGLFARVACSARSVTPFLVARDVASLHTDGTFSPGPAQMETVVV